MDWLRRKTRRCLAVSVPLLSAGLVVVWMGWNGSPLSRGPVGGFPLAAEDIGLSNPTGSLTELLAGSSDPDRLPILSSPFSSGPLRSALASRSGQVAGSYDVRMFRDELSSYTIDLRPDVDETTNVELASQTIDGTVIRPYEVFSFNSAVGERSESRGFRPGLMFSKGEVVTGLGGGVCLVSTALYNCAVSAGCKIIERFPHSGPVRYAWPGLDAAVVYGLADMRFKNDTGLPVMIRSQVADGRLTVSLWGKRRPGFEVEVAQEAWRELPFKVTEAEDSSIPEGTVQVKVPGRAGFEVTVVRILKQHGKEIKREVLSHDRIPPRDKIVLIPPKPKEEGSTLAPTGETQAPGIPPDQAAPPAQPPGTPQPAPAKAAAQPGKQPGTMTITLPPDEPDGEAGSRQTQP